MGRSTLGRRFLAAAAAVGLLCVGGSARASTTFTVDSTADTPGNCSVAGQCTLRAAITAANGAGGSNVVVLPAGTYTLTAGALAVTGTLELDGAGAAATTVDGGGVGRVFDARDASGLTLSGVRITGGHVPDESGGAILVNADTTLRNVAIDHNTAGQGAGIYGGAGSLTVIGSTISHNTASGTAANGGGIAFHGNVLRVLDSVVSDNSVVNTHLSLVGQGGGINGGGARLVIDSSTISGNSASGGAGAFAGAVFAGGRTVITNTTISGNTADGVAAIETGGRASIVNSTISGNSATGVNQPGGIFTNIAGLEIVNSTIADNLPVNITSLVHTRLFGDVLSIASGGGHANCDTGGFASAGFDSDGYNVSSDASCKLIGPGDVESQDPLLGALQDNGGGTQTRFPGVGSPALSIFPAGVALPPTDQRGVFRPASGADAGAVERAAGSIGVTVSAPATVLSGETFDVVLTLRNRSGASVTGAALALGATSRTIGALADGTSDVELFSVSASSPSTCAGAPLVLDFSATWNGTAHTGSYPVHVTPNCGAVTGQVTASGLKVVGAKVDVCLTTLATCTEVTTDPNGVYTASVPNGSYTVKAYPTASSPQDADATTVGPVTVTAPSSTTQNITLTPVKPPPDNVTVTTLSPPGSNGVPQVPRGFGAVVTFSWTCGGPPPTSWSLAAGGGVVFTGAVTPLTSGSFQLTIPPHLSFFGIGSVAVGCITFPFNYYDPSGVVKDTHGAPITGATVTLFRSDSAGGPFTAVTNGSDVMSPDNRRNPDQTLADGSYAWDVVGGFYKVRAEKAGCHAPGSAQTFVESSVLEIPPPATGVDLQLECTADQTIAVTTHAPASAAFGTSFGVAATAPGGAVGFSSAGVCSNVGATFTMTSGTGTCTVRYDQAGNGTYNAAPQIVESVTAQKAVQTITVTTHAPTAAAVGSSFTVAATAPGGAVAYASAGACSNSGTTFTLTVAGTCTVRYDQAGTGNYAAAPQVVETVTAAVPKFTLKVVLATFLGGGTVVSTPSGITCGTQCTADFDAGTSVTLTATPDPGALFQGWSGACTGTGSCVVSMDGAKTVTASFSHHPPKLISCVVPNVKRKPLATAKRKIAASHCKTGRVTQARSKTVAKGKVVSQKPKPGTKLRAGSKVSLVVSRGRR